MTPDPANAHEATAHEATGREAAHSPEGHRVIGSTRPLAVDPLLDDPRTRIVVCCGAGGVGKTTTAAALGVRAAERGRKVVVLTIDPARRLAQSMGIDSLDNTPRRVKGIDGDGELHAMMLDMKRTFDEIVEAHADPDRASAILGNPFYQSLSAGFAGTQEYMAMEKLGQLRARDEWDLIIVDTPPSRSALDFLDAPKRLGSFLDGKLIRVLLAPAKVGGRAGMKFLNVGMSMMTGALGKLLGGQLLKDVQTFVAAMDSMFGGFRTRADATYKLLQAPGTAFLVVAAPERDALREAAYFVERLAAEDMPLAGLVLNRVHGSGAAQLSAERALAAAENLEEPGIVDQMDGKAVRNSPDTQGSSDSSDRSGSSDHAGSPDRAGSPASPASSDSPATTGTEDGSPAPDLTVEQLTSGLLRLHAERMRMLSREQRTRDRFTALHPEVAVAEVAALPGDVHDLAGLRDIGDRLAAIRPELPVSED
ncbi:MULTISPECIES: ArsA family ATPase [Streptomyces]|uniref:Putative anion-transporting ATPase n=1 Tax=Streptomyces scabiei (strain 87.22) TaxID=680198 RepID=C9Z3V7_STRSW|nr:MULTISPECIES: ArsA family ATPase [Streptomyces]MBP5868879.1 ArsA family ATPase [Streptomyces sp. LBUM 1485]KFG09187.1 ABC transporter ATPase [Streptomyces scabiei]MBP5915197.1 ArsA family ATPase [Streptomyces sp. LBUM 1486]MDX2575436.1 ArsA family ATPase [Streptomyces scabiei]MDX2653084.1 ArsA family ATPase [Streptomyces scabiei]